MRDPGILFWKSPYITVKKSAIRILFSFPPTNQKNNDLTIEANKHQEFFFEVAMARAALHYSHKILVRGRIHWFFHIVSGACDRGHAVWED